jgi:Transposase DDE domain
VNNRDKNFTEHKLKVRIEHLEKSVSQYLADLDRADRQPGLIPQPRVAHLKDKIETVKAEITRLNEMSQRVKESPDGQVSLTDPDARAMVSKGRGTGVVGYNVQAAVDTKHHMIVAHEVTNVGTDRALLYPMADAARQALGVEQLTAFADRGYFSGEQIRQCAQQGVSAMVPKPRTSISRADGRFDKQDFVYIAETDEYRCPADQRAIRRFTTIEDGLTIHRYWPSACPKCPIKAQCTPSPYRRISRWEHEQVLEEMQKRLDRAPESSRVRRQTAEHPFGTLKAWMGATHFLTKTLPKVRTEMSLHVLAYNLKRAMRILGMQPLLKAIAV